ncbi:Putative transporter YfdV [Neorhizobium galegae bv. orientalis]|nr:Putative transporter YfdV [Neorhizobium galegae bv. orientalis]
MAETILLALTPIFFVMALGYLAGRNNIVDNHHVDGLNVLVMNFALPASLFAATASAPRTELISQAPLFFLLGGMMLAVFFVWYFLQTRILKIGKPDASLQGLTIAFPNLAGVGLPILADIVGTSGTVPLAVAIASGSILISPLSLVLVEMNVHKGDSGSGQKANILQPLFHALTKPIVIAPALGIIYSLCGFPVGEIAQASLLLIGHAAPGVALFLTGVVLSSQAFQLSWKVVNATLFANILRPLATAALVFALPVSSDTAKIAILLATIPSGFFGILFAVNYKLDSGATGSMVIASTVFSVVTLPIAIILLYPR